MSQPLAQTPEVEDHRIGTVLAELQVTSQDTPLAAPETLAQKVRVELLPALEEVFAHPDVLGRDAVINALEIDLGDWPGDPDWSAVRMCFRDRLLAALAPYLRAPSQAQDHGPTVAPGRSTKSDLVGRVGSQAQTGSTDQFADDQHVAETELASAARRVVEALRASSGQTSGSILTTARKQDPSGFDELLRSVSDTSHRALLAEVSAEGDARVTPGMQAMEHALYTVFARAGHSAQTARRFAAQMVSQMLVRPTGSALAQALPGDQPEGVAPNLRDQKERAAAHIGDVPSHVSTSGVQIGAPIEPISSHRGRDSAVPSEKLTEGVASNLRDQNGQTGAHVGDVPSPIPASGAQMDTPNAPISGQLDHDRAMPLEKVRETEVGQVAPDGLKADWTRDPERSLQRFAALDVAALLSLIHALLPAAQEGLGAALDALVERSNRPEAALILVLRAVLDGRPIDLDEIERAAAASPLLSQTDERGTGAVPSDGVSVDVETPSLWRTVVGLLLGAGTGVADHAADTLAEASQHATSSDDDHTAEAGSRRSIGSPETQPPVAEDKQRPITATPETGMGSSAREARPAAEQSAPRRSSPTVNNDAGEKAAPDHSFGKDVEASETAPSDHTTSAGSGAATGEHLDNRHDEDVKNTTGSGGPISPDHSPAPPTGEAGHTPESAASETHHPQAQSKSDTEQTAPASISGGAVRERIDLPKATALLAEAAFGAASDDLRHMLDLIWAVLDAETRADVERRLLSPMAPSEQSGAVAQGAQLPPAILLDLIARSGPGQHQLDELLAHLLDILMPQAEDQRQLLRLMITRLGYVQPGFGAPAVRDRVRAGLERVFDVSSRAPVPSVPAVPAARDTAEDPAQRLLTHQSGLVLFHPFLKLLFSRLDLLSADDRMVPDHLPRALAVLDALCGVSTSERRVDPLARLLLGMTDDMPPPVLTDIGAEDAELVEGLLRSVIAQWSKLGQTSPKGLQEAFVRRTGQIRFDTAGAHLRVDPGPFDILLDGLPWAMDTTLALPWMVVPCHVTWRSQDG